MSDIMSGVFPDWQSARSALVSLNRVGLKVKAVRVCCGSTDEFQHVAGKFEHRNLGEYMVLYGLTGALAGAPAAVLIAALIPESHASLVPFLHTAVLLGATIGATLGTIVGATLHLDSVDCSLTRSEGELPDGSVVLCVKSHGTKRRQLASEILRKCGAVSVS